MNCIEIDTHTLKDAILLRANILGMCHRNKKPAIVVYMMDPKGDGNVYEGKYEVIDVDYLLGTATLGIEGDNVTQPWHKWTAKSVWLEILG